MAKPGEPEIVAKMRGRGLAAPAVEDFLAKWRQLSGGRAAGPDAALAQAWAWPDVTPMESDALLRLPTDPQERQAVVQAGDQALRHLVVIKLNGGRSTTMGGDVPKCTVVAKAGLSYLEIVLRHLQALNRNLDSALPLVLMNSFFTDRASRALTKDSAVEVLHFLQTEFPRLDAQSLAPIDTDSEDDWAPAGHGDFYTSFYHAPLFEQLLERGYRWAFVSNIDNLAASVSREILGVMARDNLPFIMEATRKTVADVKGGAPVLVDGRPALLEGAQVPAEHRDAFQDINRFLHFNTNNLWIDMLALQRQMQGGKLHLPLIVNRKRLGPHDIIQLETAMGAALQCFEGAAVYEVSRDRFFPTKTLGDLLTLHSDLALLNDDWSVSRNPKRANHLPPNPEWVFGGGFMADTRLDKYFADPDTLSLVDAASVEVHGRVFFEERVTLRGRVVIENHQPQTLTIGRGTILQDTTKGHVGVVED